MITLKITTYMHGTAWIRVRSLAEAQSMAHAWIRDKRVSGIHIEESNVNNEGIAMAGYITRQEVIHNARLIVELYGLGVLLRCLNSRGGETFLGIVTECQTGNGQRGDRHRKARRISARAFSPDFGIR